MKCIGETADWSSKSQRTLQKVSCQAWANIQDGLFRNILFYGIDELYLDSKQIEFTTRLKLTGNVEGELMLPVDGEEAIDLFAEANNLKSSRRHLLSLLHQEVTINPGFSIEIAPNT